MPNTALRKMRALELEEKVLNGASVASLICVFFPWVGGEWLGGKVITYSGLGFFTSFIGLSVLLLHVFILLVTLIPLTGGPQIVKKSQRHIVRMLCAILASILTIAVWSVLTKFTFEFSRLQIHFGLYGTLVGSIITALYAFLCHQEDKRSVTHDIFHQRDPVQKSSTPPPSLEPEQHRIHP